MLEKRCRPSTFAPSSVSRACNERFGWCVQAARCMRCPASCAYHILLFSIHLQQRLFSQHVHISYHSSFVCAPFKFIQELEKRAKKTDLLCVVRSFDSGCYGARTAHMHKTQSSAREAKSLLIAFIYIISFSSFAPSRCLLQDGTQTIQFAPNKCNLASTDSPHSHRR